MPKQQKKGGGGGGKKNKKKNNLKKKAPGGGERKKKKRGGGGGGGKKIQTKYIFKKCTKNAMSPFGNGSRNNSICATIRIGQEIPCLLCAGFKKNIYVGVR